MQAGYARARNYAEDMLRLAPKFKVNVTERDRLLESAKKIREGISPWYE